MAIMDDWIECQPLLIEEDIPCRVFQKVVARDPKSGRGLGHLSVLLSKEPQGLHLSISCRDTSKPPKPLRYPTWDEIYEARYRFMPNEMTVAQILPPKEEYVNIHPTTFHLWELKENG